jgi:hypothetical protein
LIIKKEIEKNPDHLIETTVEFDESDNIIAYSTLFGIKFMNIKTNKVIIASYIFNISLLDYLGKMRTQKDS